MAASLFRAMADADKFDVGSAGTAPGGDLSGVAEVLAERGVSFAPESCALDTSMAPDLLVVVCEEGCAACPYLPGASRVLRWPFEDPAHPPGPRHEALRAIVAGLETRMVELLGADGER